MEKEKRKTRPRNRKTIGVVLIALLLILIFLCGLGSYYVYYGRSLSYFSHFKTTEEATTFLYDNFELYSTSSNDILTFMNAHQVEYYYGCSDTAPSDGGVDENYTKIIKCTVPTWGSIAGTAGYYFDFYINADDLLVYIEVRRFCLCL